MAAHFALGAILLLSGLVLSWQSSLPTDPTYHAGVVEFIPASMGTARNRTGNNMQRMRAIIESEDAKDLDILIFPEYVLNNKEMLTFVPDPALHIAPCDSPDYEYFLVELSCSARSRGLYVVLNVAEKEACPQDTSQQCNESGFNTYNTNIVFDRKGVVISRYRKTHLYKYEWYSTNVLSKPELATFKTDFGVTFGHFICFDMLFDDPAMVLLRQLNVTDIIYPTYWFSELPFLTAVQLQEGWAYANNVNLLAADASKPAGQNTGSGIYAGKFGRLAAVIYEEPTTRLLKAHVPKLNHTSDYELAPVVQPAFVPEFEMQRFTKMSLLRDYNVDIFATTLLAEEFTTVTETLCHNSFCCKFNGSRLAISASTTHAAYRYRLAAYSGSDTTFQRGDPSDLSICAIIACTTDELWSCGRTFPASRAVGNKFYFAAMNISGNFRHDARRLIMPSSVDALMMPLPVSMWTMKHTERGLNHTDVEIMLASPKSDILTFGIWANYYEQRVATHNLNSPMTVWQNSTSGAAAALYAPLVTLLVTGLMFC